MSRYDLPEPKCKHKRKGRVMAGAFDGAHASTYVCDRPECIEDAMAWAWATTHLQPTHIPDGSALIDGADNG